MNENSYLCKFIADHPNDWESLLKHDYGIKVKKEDEYAIFNYNIDCDFYSPIVQEARGIIIDYIKKEVVCWPFRKFGNHTEGYADEIDWKSARVLEKVDGSIVKLWYDKKSSIWQFSTNGVIRAENANVENLVKTTYGEIIKTADNYNDIPFDKLSDSYTYIFELVSPETRVVINYGKTSLYHLGTRDNITGKEYEIDIGIKKPESYPINSLSDCLSAANALNKSLGGEEVEKEGFVVVDKNYNRVKIKSPDYIMMHHVSLLKTIGKKECLSMLLSGETRLQTIFERSPMVVPAVKFYDYKLSELLLDADRIGALAVRLYEEYSHDRKAVAKIIAKHRLSSIGFKCIDTGKTAREVIESMPIEALANFIPDYERVDDFNELFSE
jgi:hypothetical protein